MILALIGLPLALGAIGADVYDRLPLVPEGNPDVILSDDIDGDGDGDLLMVDGRHASGFLFAGGRMPERPSFAFDLPEDAVFLDLGDREEDGARELVMLTPRGVVTVSFLGGKPSEPAPILALSRDDIVLHAVPAGDVRWNNVLLDVDGRGAEDALLPTEDGYRVFLRESKDEFVPAGVVPVRPTGRISLSGASDLGSVEQTVVMPRVFVGELNGDERPEILTFDGRNISAFTRPNDPNATWTVILEKNLYDASESLPEEVFSSRNVRVEDLDGTGRSSMIVVRSLDGELDVFATVSDDQPFGDRRTLRLDGWILPPKLIDLDGDGRIDLLAPTVEEIGYVNLMKIFVTRTFKMRYAIFRNRADVRYARTPDAVREIVFPLEYDSSGGDFQVENQMIYSFDGDYDGDGRKDFLVKESPTELVVFGGLADASFDDAPMLRVAVEDMSSFLTVSLKELDLNRDGRTDLLLHYRSRSGAGNDRYFLDVSRPE